MIQWFYKLIPAYADEGVVRTALQLFSIVLINIKGTALSVMIFTAAIGAIPQEIEDSAMIDGASSWQYIRHILLPLLKVPIVSLIVIMLPLIYNQFLEPYVYLDPKNSTLLPFTQSAVGQFSTNFQVIYSAIFASVVPYRPRLPALPALLCRGRDGGRHKGIAPCPKRSVVFQPATHRGLQRGVNALVNAVRPTLGPRPRLVAIANVDYHEQDATGYSTMAEPLPATSSSCRTPTPTSAPCCVRDLLWRLQQQVGDGTATAAVILQRSLQRGCPLPDRRRQRDAAKILPGTGHAPHPASN